jgi:hypothetical protein
MMAGRKVLHLDRDAPAGSESAHTLEEAVARLLSGEYGTIVLHLNRSGSDEYGLRRYLASTWPDYYRSLVIRVERRAGVLPSDVTARETSEPAHGAATLGSHRLSADDRASVRG